MESALIGTKLFFRSVFPSLFPFLVICNIIICCGGINIYSKLLGNLICKPFKLPKQCSIVLIVSMLCGYPLGAKYSCKLYEENIIDIQTYEKLLNIASNASPLFIIGAVGTSMLGNVKLGYLILLSNYISCILMGFILSIHTNKPTKIVYSRKNAAKEKEYDENIGKIAQISIEDSIKTSLIVCGFVTIFSVITHTFKNSILLNVILSKFIQTSTVKKIVESSLLGLLEMTNGCSMISTISIDLSLKLVIISFLISFSGLSIIMQVYSFTYKHSISIMKYISRKFVQGILCSITTIILYKLLVNDSLTCSLPSLNTTVSSKAIKVYIILLCMFIIPLLLKKILKLFHLS